MANTSLRSDKVCSVMYFQDMKGLIKNNALKHRENSGLTQEELADKVGVTRQTIITLEKGNYTPSVSLALKLAKVFKCSVEDLFKLS